MQISKTMASNLIREISTVIDYDINIMDESGTIIASTDSIRIGQFHEGAHRLLKYHLKELLVYFDEEYAGCKKGINLPLVMKEDIIGVVGITGDVEETIHYARLIKKMTEMLVKDLSRLQKHSRKEQEKMLFINDWLNGEIDAPQEIEQFLHKYGIHPNKPITVALAALSPDRPEHLLSDFTESCFQRAGIVSTVRDNLGIIIGNFPTAEKCRSYIQSQFSRSYSAADFLFTIGNSSETFVTAVTSYQQALKTLQQKQHQLHSGIILYDEVLLEVIFTDTSKTHQQHLLKKVFSSCRKEDLSEMVRFIQVYYENNGSINAIAKQLFIHKNTVQYKIGKIIAQTGLDLRIFHDMILLYLASLWYEKGTRPVWEQMPARK